MSVEFLTSELTALLKCYQSGALKANEYEACRSLIVKEWTETRKRSNTALIGLRKKGMLTEEEYLEMKKASRYTWWSNFKNKISKFAGPAVMAIIAGMLHFLAPGLGHAAGLLTN